MFRRRVSKRAGGGRGHIEEGRRLDALGEQNRRREELQQKRRRMRLLRAVLCAVCDRCGARSASFGFRGELGERCATTAGAP